MRRTNHHGRARFTNATTTINGKQLPPPDYPGVYTYDDTSWFAHPWFPKFNKEYWDGYQKIVKSFGPIHSRAVLSGIPAFAGVNVLSGYSRTAALDHLLKPVTQGFSDHEVACKPGSP